jgi:hypothetical protein
MVMIGLTDFRGNVYAGGAKLGVPCSVEGCQADAVRHACNAEGDPHRTHWHGEIHSLAQGAIAHAYCDAHGQAVLRDNAAMRERRDRESD